jgi:hypothetical protein
MGSSSICVMIFYKLPVLGDLTEHRKPRDVPNLPGWPHGYRLMPVPVTFLGAASGEIGFGLLQNGVVADWNAKTLYRARSRQRVDAVTKKVNNFSYLMRPACAGRSFSGDHSSKASHRLRKTQLI